MLTAPLRLYYYGLLGAFLMLLLIFSGSIFSYPNIYYRAYFQKRKEQQIMKILRKNGEIIEANFEDSEAKKAFWHTSAHVLAQAVKRL